MVYHFLKYIKIISVAQVVYSACIMRSHTFKGADMSVYYVDHTADIFLDAVSRYCKQYGCNISLLQAIPDATYRYCKQYRTQYLYHKRYKLVVDKEWCSDDQVLKSSTFLASYLPLALRSNATCEAVY